MTATRTLPFSLDAERSVLGALLLERSALAAVAELVTAEDFHHPGHSAAFAAVAALDAADKPVDALTVAEQMRAAEQGHKLEGLGGLDALLEMATSVIVTENVAFHARIVAGKSRVRRLATAAQAITAACYADHADSDELCEDAEQQILAITTSRAPSRNLRAAVVAQQVIAELKTRAEGRSSAGGILTGLRDVDEMLGGLAAPRLYVLAARPSLGKTALAWQIAETAATWNVPVFVCSLEMGADELLERGLSGRAEVEGRQLRRGEMSGEQWGRVYRAGCDYERMPLTVNAEATTLAQVRAAARRWRRETWQRQAAAPGLLVLDYLQLVDHQRQRGESEAEAIGRTSVGLKRLAKELRVPVLALAQLNRESEKDARRPRRSDLRGSGQIEQDADVIMFLHAEPKHMHADERPTELIVDKQRNGRTGSVKLTFHRGVTRFADVEEAQQQWHPYAPGNDLEED